MLRADTVMDADQPRLKIGKDEMDDGQELLCHFGIPTFGNGVVIVPTLSQARVAAPIVRDDQCPRGDGATHKSAKRFGASVSEDRQPNAPRITPISSLVLRGSRLSVAHLNGAGDQNLVVYTPTFAARSATDPAFIHLYMLVRTATDAVPIRANHSGAQFVENLKSCLITRNPKLPLELHG